MSKHAGENTGVSRLDVFDRAYNAATTKLGHALERGLLKQDSLNHS